MTKKILRARKIPEQLVWEKMSYKTSVAHLGAVSLGVDRIGLAPNYTYRGEVFGNPYALGRRYATFEEARQATEHRAKEIIRSLYPWAKR